MSNNNTVVNIHTTKTFTDEHLEISKHYINEKTRPELYGDLLSFGKDLGRHLVDIKDIKWRGSLRGGTQAARAAGANPSYKEVRNSIIEFGYKLTNEPIALWKRDDGYYPLTGHTRETILSDQNVKNVIANVYEMNSEDEGSKFSLKLNRGPDPQGIISQQDVQEECLNALRNGWVQPSIDSILGRVNEICGDSVFTENKRTYIATLVYNTWDDKKPGSQTVLSWPNESVINQWMSTNKYVDVGNVIYMTTSFSQVSKAIFRAAALSVENSDKEIRVVVHTSILDAYDLKGCYDNRVDTFRTMWFDKLKDLRIAFFKSYPADNSKVVLANNITLYGALPALGNYHDLNKIVKYKNTSQSVNEVNED